MTQFFWWEGIRYMYEKQPENIAFSCCSDPDPLTITHPQQVIFARIEKHLLFPRGDVALDKLEQRLRTVQRQCVEAVSQQHDGCGGRAALRSGQCDRQLEGGTQLALLPTSTRRHHRRHAPPQRVIKTGALVGLPAPPSPE